MEPISYDKLEYIFERRTFKWTTPWPAAGSGPNHAGHIDPVWHLIVDWFIAYKPPVQFKKIIEIYSLTSPAIFRLMKWKTFPQFIDFIWHKWLFIELFICSLSMDAPWYFALTLLPNGISFNFDDNDMRDHSVCLHWRFWRLPDQFLYLAGDNGGRRSPVDATGPRFAGGSPIAANVAWEFGEIGPLL